MSGKVKEEQTPVCNRKANESYRTHDTDHNHTGRASYSEYRFGCARSLHSSQRSFHFLLALLLLCAAYTCVLIRFVKRIKLIFSESKSIEHSKATLIWIMVCLIFRSVAKSPEMKVLEKENNGIIRMQMHVIVRARYNTDANGKLL